LDESANINLFIRIRAAFTGEPVFAIQVLRIKSMSASSFTVAVVSNDVEKEESDAFRIIGRETGLSLKIEKLKYKPSEVVSEITLTYKLPSSPSNRSLIVFSIRRKEFHM
jgi:hypothetical protein